MLGRSYKRFRRRDLGIFLIPLSGAGLFSHVLIPFTLPMLFFTFLKIGSVLYGSGYVLLAFLRADFVMRFGWLSDQQLIDAIAIGQITPGTVFTTATFIGFILGMGQWFIRWCKCGISRLNGCCDLAIRPVFNN